MTLSNARERIPAEIVELVGAGLSGDDRDFFFRVWSENPAKYESRLRAAGMVGLDHVLDAGCGFGQWTLPLAAINRRITAIDVDEVRTQTVGEIASRSGADNIEVLHSGVEATHFPDAAFDGIFSYSVLCFTDYRRTIREFGRLLSSGGLLYLCTNGLGWYVHNLLDGHNSTATFDSRAMAIETLQNTLEFYANGGHEAMKQIITPSIDVREQLEQNGLEILALGSEGTCTVPGGQPGPSFFKGEYYGAEGVYELIARKEG